MQSKWPSRVAIDALNVSPGGGATVVVGLAVGLSLLGHRVDVLASRPETAGLFEDQLGGIAGVTVRRVGRAATPLGAQLWRVGRLGRTLEELGAGTLVNINAHAVRTRVPQVTYHLNLLRFEPKDRTFSVHAVVERLRDAQSRRALARSAANVFESEYLLRVAAESTGRQIAGPRVVHIGLPDYLLDRTRARLGALRSGPERAPGARLLAVTSPQPHKDNPTLLRVLARLVESAPARDWRLDIAGGRSPDVWAPLREKAAALGIADRLTFHGFCTPDGLARLYDQSLCLVSASRVESFCMVALEAMASGCPAIVADATSMPESVGDAGLLAVPGDADDFARWVLRLHDEPAFRGRKVAEGLAFALGYGWRRSGEQFSEIIGDLAGKAGG